MKGQFLIFLSGLLFFGCNDNKKTSEQKPVALPPQYFYFPRANVYFDSANKEYIFPANDSGAWQTAKQIPNVVQGLMDKSVYIQAPSQPVWRDNEKHKLVYSALLYATPEDTVEKKVAPKPIAKAPEKPLDSLTKKQRKGIGKIVDKIFSIFKKDKKKKDTTE